MALSTAVAATATAQLAAPQQPTQRLLVLPFQASAADSAGSIALADAVRDRVTTLAKAKVQVIAKAKLCEALKAWVLRRTARRPAGASPRASCRCTRT
jgi:hypothetical protein